MKSSEQTDGRRNTEPSHLSERPTLNKNERRAIFKKMAAQELEAGLLRYSRRQRLIHYGRMLGFSPFEAHLLIAEAQYEAGHLLPPTFDSTANLERMSDPEAWPTWFKVSFALIAAMIIDLLIIQFVLT
jgi:hypothetical protein